MMRARVCVGGAILVASVLAGCSSKSVTDLAVGSCFNFDEGAATLNYVPTVACSGAHDAEVFYLYDISGVTTYNDNDVFSTAVEGCIDPFEKYTGFGIFTADADKYDVYAMYPTKAGWDGGDRGAICTIVSIDSGTQLTGSLQKAAG